jgi:hypothetical protein
MLHRIIPYKLTDVSALLTASMMMALVMETVSTSETSLKFYETTRRSIPQGNHLRLTCSTRSGQSAESYTKHVGIHSFTSENNSATDSCVVTRWRWQREGRRGKVAGVTSCSIRAPLICCDLNCDRGASLYPLRGPDSSSCHSVV